jgi:hypothetical protein
MNSGLAMRTWAHVALVFVGMIVPLLVACRDGPGEAKPQMTDSFPATLTKDQVVALAKSIHLKELDLDDSNMNEVVELLQHGLDAAASDQARPQIRLAEAWSVAGKSRRSPAEVRLTLSLRNIPLETALEYVGEQTSTGFRYEDGFVSLTPSLASWGERKRCACGAFLDEDPAHSGAGH